MSRQITVFIQTVFMLIIIIKLFKNQLGMKKELKYVLLLILSGVSGQFLFEIFGDATYGTIVFYMILELWLFIKYIDTNKKINLILFSVILVLISGCSLRFPVYIGAPLICCALYLIYNNPKDKKPIIMLCCIVTSILIGYGINKYLSNNLTILSSTTNRVIGNTEDYADAVHNTNFKYLWVAGATDVKVRSLTVLYTNDKITTTSPYLLISFIKSLYAIITIVMPFLLFKKFKLMNQNEKILHIYTVSLTIIILYFLYFCGMWWWYRYITPVVFFLTLLYALYYKYFFNNKFKDKVVFFIVIVLFSLSSFILSLSSWYNVENKKILKNPYENMVKYLEKNKLSYGYIDGLAEHNIFRLISNNKVQITRLNGLSALYWLNSKEWFTEDYHKGTTFVIRNKTSGEQLYDKEAIKKLEYEGNYIFIFKEHKDLLQYLSL